MYHIISSAEEFIGKHEDFIEACAIAIKFQNENRIGFVVYEAFEVWNTDFLKEDGPLLTVVPKDVAA